MAESQQQSRLWAPTSLGVHFHSFSILLSDLGLNPTARTTVDYFLFIANDTSIDNGFFLPSHTSTTKGVMTLSLVTNVGDGEYRQVVDPVVIDKPNREQPVEIGEQVDDLIYGRPVYLRVLSQAEDGATAWWASAVTRLHGTLHLLN